MRSIEFGELLPNGAKANQTGRNNPNLSFLTIVPILTTGEGLYAFVAGFSMFRRLINSYLIAILLAGPCLCCCSLSRASTKDCPIATDGGLEIESHSCCHSEPDDHAPEKSQDCPCRKHQDQQATSLGVEASIANARLVAELSWPSLLSAWTFTGESSQADDSNHLSRQSLESTFSSAQDLLRAFSVMRC